MNPCNALTAEAAQHAQHLSRIAQLIWSRETRGLDSTRASRALARAVEATDLDKIETTITGLAIILAELARHNMNDRNRHALDAYADKFEESR